LASHATKRKEFSAGEREGAERDRLITARRKGGGGKEWGAGHLWRASRGGGPIVICGGGGGRNICVREGKTVLKKIKGLTPPGGGRFKGGIFGRSFDQLRKHFSKGKGVARKGRVSPRNFGNELRTFRRERKKTMLTIRGKKIQDGMVYLTGGRGSCTGRTMVFNGGKGESVYGNSI